MKILFVSIPSIHVIRWIENLKETSLELYWFDVLDRGRLNTLDSVHQFTGWKKRKFPHIKGEYFLNEKFPEIYGRIQPFLEVTANEKLEKIIRKINPDVIHSFEMQGCSYPIIKTMYEFPCVKWVYSCWGSDLFYYQNFLSHKKKIRQVLKRVDYLLTDCNRDIEIAKELGFAGKHLGVIPGGTGYDLKQLEKYKLPLDQRKIILVKGYQHLFGRGLVVVQALKELKQELKGYEVAIFGAHQVVVDYVAQNHLPFQVYHRNELTQNELIILMGQSLICIGNSISDGIPNTLLEAIIMGAFPIQSNPGGVTAEIITSNKNGFLIENPESVEEIKSHILETIDNFEKMKDTEVLNAEIAKTRLSYEDNQQKVIDLYYRIQKEICE